MSTSQESYQGAPEDHKAHNPAEEMRLLQERLRRQEERLKQEGTEHEQMARRQAIEEALSEYAHEDPSSVLAPEFQITEAEINLITLGLEPDRHDETMMVFLGVLQERGIRNALTVVERMNNMHLEDDFHRVLVQYVNQGFTARGLTEGAPLWKVLNMTLYEVSLPAHPGEQAQSLKEMLSAMEQFYSGMLSVADKKSLGKAHFTLELALSDTGHEIIFYVAVPTHRKDLFEKHLLSIFPRAQIREQKNDYNVFVDGGESLASVAVLDDYHLKPIKTYEDFDYDPLNILLNAFSKIEREGGGAAVQFVFSPAGNAYHKEGKKVISKLKDGMSLKQATRGFVGDMFAGLGSIIVDMAKSEGDDKQNEQKSVDQSTIDLIEEKMETVIVRSNVRLVASADTESRAEDILSDLESTFNQFASTKANKVAFTRPKGAALKSILRSFIYREFTGENALALSIKELSTLIHFPARGVESTPQFKQAKSATAPAPMNPPKEGTLLGINEHRNTQTEIRITKEDRLRHFYVIGQTGTGKTTLLKNMIIQDIHDGDGVCMIDPHGEDIVDVLGAVPPERFDDVIYFDPGYIDRVMAFNILEYDTDKPEQKTFVVNECFSIFQKLYGGVPESMGPMFEQYFRNATGLVLEDPESGSTLLDVARIFADRDFRMDKLSKSTNPVVNQFWEEIASRAQGDHSIESIAPYITSKFDSFLANEVMRPIIGQQKSSFNFREVMDTKKILLVNLSKGRLGDLNANLIGLVLVGKILMAALSRTDTRANDYPPFYLYIDEFQNITTNSIATILSEARKYRLSLTIAHQFVAQLRDEIKQAVFGNVGSLAAFRVGTEDAEFLEKQFKPTFSAPDLMGIENRNAYVRLLVDGAPEKPFNIHTMPPYERNLDIVEELKRRSYEKYGAPRAEVQEAVLKKYLKKPKPPHPPRF